MPHEPRFSSSLPSQLCSFPCSSALHMLPLNNSRPPPASPGWHFPRATASTLCCGPPSQLPAGRFLIPAPSPACILLFRGLSVLLRSPCFVKWSREKMVPVYLGAAGMLTRGWKLHHTPSSSGQPHWCCGSRCYYMCLTKQDQVDEPIRAQSLLARTQTLSQ